MPARQAAALLCTEAVLEGSRLRASKRAAFIAAAISFVIYLFDQQAASFRLAKSSMPKIRENDKK